jgi:hypothetical protein
MAVFIGQDFYYARLRVRRQRQSKIQAACGNTLGD